MLIVNVEGYCFFLVVLICHGCFDECCEGFCCLFLFLRAWLMMNLMFMI